ncbi:MAG: hypothetical protein AAF570_07215 [Bacteroidota bacterium]
MKNRDFLFELIATMSRAEKRKCVAFLNFVGSEPIVIELFEKFAKSRSPEKVKAWGEQNLAFYRKKKSQLKKEVMNFLRFSRESRTPANQITQLIEEFEVLYPRGLYVECQRLMQRAYDVAVKNRQLLPLMKILDLRKKLEVEQNPKALKSELGELVALKDEVLEKFELEVKWGKLHYQLLALFRLGREFWPEEKEMLAGVLAEDSAQFRSFAPLVSHRTILYFWSARALAHKLLGEQQGYYESYKELCAFFDQNAGFRDLPENRRTYRNMLSNYANACFAIEDYREAKGILNQIRAFKNKDFDEEAEQFQAYTLLSLLYYINSADQVGKDELIEETVAGLEKYSAKINAARRVSILMNLVFLCFVNDEFGRAEWFLERLLDGSRLRVRREVVKSAKLLGLILLVEKESFKGADSLEIAFESTRMFVERNGGKNEVDRTIFRMVWKLLKGGGEAAGPILEEWHEKFQELMATHANHPLTEIILFWLRSKIEGVPIAKLIRSKQMEKQEG